MGSSGGRLGIQLGFAVAGAVAGHYAPGVGAGVAFAAGALAGGITGALLFPIESPDTSSQGPRLEDLAVQTSTYGNAIPICYGTVCIAGNVIWSTGLIETATNETIEQGGGKGGGSSTSTRTTYSYSVSLAIGLCQGPITGIKRIWADDELWFDYTNPPPGTYLSGQLYLGDEEQLPDPTIEADKGAGNVPAHRGLAYIVFTNLQLEKWGNRVPNFHFEVVVSGTTSAHVIDIDSGGNLDYYSGNIAIDPETGLVWVVRTVLQRVDIVKPDTWEIIDSITGFVAPYGISYQPAFMALKMDTLPPLLTGSLSETPISDPEVVEVAPKMYIGSNIPLLIGGAFYAVQTRTHKVHKIGWDTHNQLNGDWVTGFGTYGGFLTTNGWQPYAATNQISFHFVPWKPQVVLDSIKFDQINQIGTPHVVFWEGGGFNGHWPVTILIPLEGCGGPVSGMYNAAVASVIYGDIYYMVVDH